MPISNNAFVRTTVLMLLVGFLALAGIVGTTLWLVQQNQEWADQTSEARGVRVAAVAMRSVLQDAETGQRGFLLTGEQSYLEPYQRAAPQIAPQLEQLVQVLAPYSDPEALARLRAAVTEKVVELDQTIALMREGRRDEAVAIVLTDKGKEAMDEARALFESVIDGADGQIFAAVEHQRNASLGLRWVTVIGAFVIFAVVAGSAWTVLTYTRELATARRDIEIANATLEARVSERTSDLGRANEEIQRFAYIVTHDLRAPLVNIMGFTSELETSVGLLSGYMSKIEDNPDPAFAEARMAATEDLPEAITFIRAATRKMDSLINAILKISREGRRQLKPETVNLQAVVDASTAAIQHQVVENGGQISADIKVPRVVTDKLSLDQVLGNLLDNAVKYRHPERPLTVSIRSEYVAGNRIEIQVEDNGRGIAPEDHERVFELFRRAGAQSQPGEGIGLAHVRTMVRSLGGDVTLRSVLGAGTTFIVTLPRDLRSFIGSQTA